jgi:hypothetical protein
MRREVHCSFRLAKTTDLSVTAILESGELILRGAMRRSIPLDNVHNLQVKGEDLCFKVGDESFFLALGSAEAASWAEIIATRAPFVTTIAAPSQPAVRRLLQVNEDAIRAVLEDAARASATMDNPIMVRVDTPDALISTLEHASKGFAKGKPIWFIYSVDSRHSTRSRLR